ncbi:hypothetical protein [Afifella aestuarii]|uniref:hypothetical protein n=1 Tax=Afifella aestuarii TaxID=1909496 RepID=UPI000FE41B8F|nr:hypothetical protein [Afifella aestuarii]
MIDRDPQGRFTPGGQSPNPRGRPRRRSPEEHVQHLLEQKLPTMLEQAFDASERSDEVLAGLLNLLAAHVQGQSLSNLQLELAQIGRVGSNH